MAKILPVLQLFRLHVGKEDGRKFLNLGGKLMREIMFTQGNFDFHSRRTVIPKNFDDATDRLRVLARLLDYFDRDNLTRLGPMDSSVGMRMSWLIRLFSASTYRIP